MRKLILIALMLCLTSCMPVKDTEHVPNYYVQEVERSFPWYSIMFNHRIELDPKRVDFSVALELQGNEKVYIYDADCFELNAYIRRAENTIYIDKKSVEDSFLNAKILSIIVTEKLLLPI